MPVTTGLRGLRSHPHCLLLRAPSVSHLGWWPALCLIVITFVNMCPVVLFGSMSTFHLFGKQLLFSMSHKMTLSLFPPRQRHSLLPDPCHVPGRPDLFCWLCKSAERHGVQRALGMPLISIVHRCCCWMNLLPLPKFFSEWS